MSTAELGLSLAEMIRRDKVHAICCTGANLEEDVFNLVAHDHYRAHSEMARTERRRRTSSARPAPESGHGHLHSGRRKRCGASRQLVLQEWMNADREGRTMFPHRISLRRSSRDDRLSKYYQIDPKDSWLYAAMRKDLPMFVPGWEDSTLGNMYASHCIRGRCEKCAYRSDRYRIHEGTSRLVH